MQECFISWNFPLQNGTVSHPAQAASAPNMDLASSTKNTHQDQKTQLLWRLLKTLKRHVKIKIYLKNALACVTNNTLEQLSNGKALAHLILLFSVFY